MTANTKDVAAMIEEFLNTTDLQRIEALADALGNSGDKAAINCLLYRLGDSQVQEDPDVEDAVCTALVKLGLMRQLGNLVFLLEVESILVDTSREALQKNKAWIPLKYIPSTSWPDLDTSITVYRTFC